MTFPANLTNAVDGVPGVGTSLVAAHLNNLEAKVGVNASAVASSLDYLIKNPVSIDPGHKHSKLWGIDGSVAYILSSDYGTNQAALIAADAAAAAAGKQLVIGCNHAITSTPASPLTANIKVIQGIEIAVATGAILTINGSVEAGDYQIFFWAGTGKVVFGGGVDRIEVAWFGNNLAAIQAALASVPSGKHKEVWLPSGSIDMGGGTLNFDGRCDLIGRGSGDYTYQYIGSRLYNGTIQLTNDASVPAYGFRMANFRLDGNGTVATGLICGKFDDVSAVGFGKFENLYITGYTTAGIDLRFISESSFHNVKSTHNTGAGMISSDTTKIFSTALEFYSCSFNNNTLQGVYLQSGAGIKFIGGVMQSNFQEGFKATTNMGWRVDGIVLDGVWIEFNCRSWTDGHYQVVVDGTTPGGTYVGKFTMRNCTWGAPFTPWNGSAGNKLVYALCKNLIMDHNNTERMIGAITMPACYASAYRMSLLGEPLTHWIIAQSTRIDTPVPGFKWVGSVTTSNTSAYQDLKSYTVQKNTITITDAAEDPVAGNYGGFLSGVRIKAAGAKVGSAGAAYLKIYFGDSVVTYPTLASAAGVWTAEIEVSLSADHNGKAVVKVDQGLAIIDRSITSPNFVTSADQLIKVQGCVANGADSVGINSFTVERF